MSSLSTFYRNVYIASLPPDYTNEQLLSLFSPYGKIISCVIRTDKKTGLCQGYGFVLFENECDACNAVLALQGHMINFTRVQVRLARPEASAKKMLPVIMQQQLIQSLYQQKQLSMMPQGMTVHQPQQLPVQEAPVQTDQQQYVVMCVPVSLSI